MFEALKNLPNDSKKSIAIWFSGGFTFLVLSVWLFFFIGTAKEAMQETAASKNALFGDFQKEIGEKTDELVKVKDEIKKMGSAYLENSNNEGNNVMVATSTNTKDLEASTTVETINTDN